MCEVPELISIDGMENKKVYKEHDVFDVNNPMVTFFKKDLRKMLSC